MAELVTVINALDAGDIKQADDYFHSVRLREAVSKITAPDRGERAFNGLTLSVAVTHLLKRRDLAGASELVGSMLTQIKGSEDYDDDSRLDIVYDLLTYGSTLSIYREAQGCTQDLALKIKALAEQLNQAAFAIDPTRAEKISALLAAAEAKDRLVVLEPEALRNILKAFDHSGYDWAKECAGSELKEMGSISEFDRRWEKNEWLDGLVQSDEVYYTSQFLPRAPLSILSAPFVCNILCDLMTCQSGRERGMGREILDLGLYVCPNRKGWLVEPFLRSASDAQISAVVSYVLLKASGGDTFAATSYAALWKNYREGDGALSLLLEFESLGDPTESDGGASFMKNFVWALRFIVVKFPWEAFDWESHMLKFSYWLIILGAAGWYAMVFLRLSGDWAAHHLPLVLMEITTAAVFFTGIILFIVSSVASRSKKPKT